MMVHALTSNLVSGWTAMADASSDCCMEEKPSDGEGWSWSCGGGEGGVYVVEGRGSSRSGAVGESGVVTWGNMEEAFARRPATSPSRVVTSSLRASNCRCFTRWWRM